MRAALRCSCISELKPVEKDLRQRDCKRRSAEMATIYNQEDHTAPKSSQMATNEIASVNIYSEQASTNNWKIRRPFSPKESNGRGKEQKPSQSNSPPTFRYLSVLSMISLHLFANSHTASSP